jgi:N-acyl-D-aspartate/D-glutamate deacylase
MQHPLAALHVLYCVHVVRVEKEENQKYLNKSIEEIAGILHKDPEDTILDLGLDENLDLGITLSVINVNKDIVEKLLKLPNTLLGLSDAGAHVAQHCDAGLPTYLLKEWVRERHNRAHRRHAFPDRSVWRARRHDYVWIYWDFCWPSPARRRLRADR